MADTIEEPWTKVAELKSDVETEEKERDVADIRHRLRAVYVFVRPRLDSGDPASVGNPCVHGGAMKRFTSIEEADAHFFGGLTWIAVAFLFGLLVISVGLIVKRPPNVMTLTESR